MPTPSTDARKLVFAHTPSDDPDASRVQLTDDWFDLDKHLPVSVDGEPAYLSGTFLELRDDQDQLLYRRRVLTPMPGSFEVWLSDGSAEHRQLADVHAGSFRVVVPRLGAAADVVLLASPDDVPPSLSAGMSEGHGIQEFARFPWPDALPNV